MRKVAQPRDPGHHKKSCPLWGMNSWRCTEKRRTRDDDNCQVGKKWRLGPGTWVQLVGTESRDGRCEWH